MQGGGGHGGGRLKISDLSRSLVEHFGEVCVCMCVCVCVCVCVGVWVGGWGGVCTVGGWAGDAGWL